MLWFTFALLGAIASAAYYALIKRYLKDTDEFVLLGGVFVCASALLLAASVMNSTPKFGPDFAWAATVSAILNILGAYLSFKALKLTDLSLAMPMISFTPLFMIATSFLILGEMPTMAGFAGILLIIAGSYALHMTSPMRLVDPLKEVTKNKGVLLMLLVAVIYSFTATIDKIVIQNSDPYLAPAFVLGIGGLFFFALTVRKQSATNIVACFVPGVVLALSAITINMALQVQIAPYVIAIKRLSIFFSVLIGGILFHELHLARRLLGAGIMVAGMLCILLL